MRGYKQHNGTFNHVIIGYMCAYLLCLNNSQLSNTCQWLLDGFLKKGGVSLIYENVKRIADKKGVTIYRIEHDVKIANGIIAKWGKTAKQEPSVTNLKKVADYLEVDMNELLEDKQTIH